MLELEAVVLGFAPGLFWLWFFHRKDRWDPEPVRWVIWAFGLGCLSAWVVGAARPRMEAVFLPWDEGTWSDLVDAFLVTATIEEVCKVGLLGLGLLWLRDLDEPVDGIVYGAAAGLGFASVENVYYMLAFGDLELMVARGATATLGHVVFTGSAGFFLGLGRGRARRTRALLVAAGLGSAIALHGAYDWLLMQGPHLGAVSIVVLLPLGLVALTVELRWALARSPHRRAQRLRAE